MKISRNNKIPDYDSITVTGDDSGDDVTKTTTADFSTAYSSAGTGSSLFIQYNFASSFVCEYIAIAGSNVGSLSGSFNVYIDGSVKDTVSCEADRRNSVIMCTFDATNVTSSVKIQFQKFASNSDIVTIGLVAAGQVWSLGGQEQEQAGFLRNWMTRSEKVRTQVNESAAPVAYVKQRIARPGTLTLNNIKRSNLGSSPFDSGTPFGDFLDHVYDDGFFFMKENDGSVLPEQPQSSSLCFDAQFLPPAAHPDTRQLNNLQLTFKTYTGY